MYISDLHIHSKYSRATSRDLVPEWLEWWGRKKGIELIGTGDFTHPAWREELKEKLQPAEDGLYTLREEFRQKEGLPPGTKAPRFVLTGEISSIYKKNGRVRKVHNVILLPGLEEAEKLSLRLETIGNLHSDGRPILGLDSRDLLEIMLESCPQAVLIPAHIWTPHFSLFGAYSGFDRIEDCFEDLTPYIHAVETGLSSDPPMNWRLSALDGYQLVSHSDAHSPSRLGREANLMDGALSYSGLVQAVQTGKGLYGTLEFFPEEGKYHYDGHRNCDVCLKPEDTIRTGGVCPVCGRQITIGVLHRVEELADRPEGYIPAHAKPFERLVPLSEVIASCSGLSAGSKKVAAQTEALLNALGPEIPLLRECPAEEIERTAGPAVAEGIRRVRAGRVRPFPGYDGAYGRVQILTQPEIERLNGQTSLFSFTERSVPQPKIKTHLPIEKKKTESVKAADSTLHHELNERQKEAVAAQEKTVAVIAGPGTGKTGTLVSRIAFLIEQLGTKASNIAAVTFTNQAARELRERLHTRLGKRAVKGITIGTFHSVCLQMLGDDAPVLLGEEEALEEAEEICVSLSLSCKPRTLLRRISAVKYGAPLEEEPLEIQKGYAGYQAALESDCAMDYDDLLLRGLAQWEAPDAGRAFAHLLVDEFQDIDPLQYRLIRAWCKDSGSLFVIGDPDQSIYGFRGADSRCFERLEEDFTPVRTIRLEKNYRSTPQIVSCALEAIAPNAATTPRTLEAVRAGGPRVRLITAADPFAEALYIVKQINRMVGGVDMLDTHTGMGAEEGRRGFSDIAVLYRTHRQAEMLEYCLKKEGIPYAVTGRESYLSAPEVRKAVEFLRFLHNPGDCSALRGLLRHAGMERSWAEKYSEGEQSPAALAALLLDPPQWLVWMAENSEKAVSSKPMVLLERWMDMTEQEQSQPMERLLYTAARHRTLGEFLQNLTLGGEGDVTRSGGKRMTADAVSLMTLHGAKGLEFPVVFLCGLSRGILPLEAPGRISDLEEERRLFYVGITRAKEELTLMAGEEPSVFLQSLSPAFLEGGATQRKETAQQLSLF